MSGTFPFIKLSGLQELGDKTQEKISQCHNEKAIYELPVWLIPTEQHT